jgi:hypothetical protein
MVRENGGSIDVDAAGADRAGARFRIVLPLLSTTSTREAA